MRRELTEKRLTRPIRKKGSSAKKGGNDALPEPKNETRKAGTDSASKITKNKKASEDGKSTKTKKAAPAATSASTDSDSERDNNRDTDSAPNGRSDDATAAAVGAVAAAYTPSSAEAKQAQAALDALNAAAKQTGASLPRGSARGSGGAKEVLRGMGVAKRLQADSEDAVISVPCFICRPTEFKLLRDTMTDRNIYASTYTEYLKENYKFCQEMAVKANHVVLRGTWDVKHYLNWCDERKQKPRASSRRAYFQEMAELAVAGKIDEPQPSFEEFIVDTEDQLLRYCCRKGCRALEDNSGDFKLCSRCQCACYCTPACQKGDWKEHKKWCGKVE